MRSFVHRVVGARRHRGARLAFAAVAVGVALAAAGCGSSGLTWTTWYSAACDARFDMPGRPASSWEASPQALAQRGLAMHRDRADNARFVYSCRTFAPGHMELKGADVVAEDVIRHELGGFDASWTAEPIRDTGGGSKGVTLTQKDGTRADIRAISVAGLSQTHATLTVGVGVDLARRFVEAIEIVPKPKPGPMRVRSAECLSSVVMPGTPSGEFAASVFTHVHKEPEAQRFWVLRCVYMDEMMQKRTPAELFQESLDDTIASGEWRPAERSDFELDGRYARHQGYTSADGQRILMVRIAVDGVRLQIASFTGKVGDEATASGFLKSYRLHGDR